MSNKKEAFDNLPSKIVHPNSLELEKNILSAMIVDESSIYAVVKYLKPYHFYETKHQAIYKAILQLYESNEAVEIYSIIETLKKLELLDLAGGMKYLSVLSAAYISNAYLEMHCKIILEKWVAREFITKLRTAALKTQKETEDVFEIIAQTMNELDVLSNSVFNDLEEKSFSERLPVIIENIIKERNAGESSTFKSIDFPSFNIATGGLKPGNLVVISGKYKSGKTRFSLSLLRDFAVNSKIACGLIGFEMDVDEYDKNLLSMQTGVRYGYLRNPADRNKDGTLKLKDEMIEDLQSKADKYFKETNIFINDKCVLDVDVISKIKFWTKKHHLKIVVIDYLQLIESNRKYERRDLELAEISKRLKNVARKENISIIVLVQENESGQSADSKGPLRDSDFWFSIVHPIDEHSYYVDKKCIVKLKDHKGNDKTIEADQSIFQVKFKASRHSANGKSFLCKFFENGEFKELSLEQDYQEDLI